MSNAFIDIATVVGVLVGVMVVVGVTVVIIIFNVIIFIIVNVIVVVSVNIIVVVVVLGVTDDKVASRQKETMGRDKDGETGAKWR